MKYVLLKQEIIQIEKWTAIPSLYYNSSRSNPQENLTIAIHLDKLYVPIILYSHQAVSSLIYDVLHINKRDTPWTPRWLGTYYLFSELFNKHGRAIESNIIL